MAFKLFVLCAALACANAGLIGAPVAQYSAYAHAPVAVHDPHVAATSQSVVRSYGGNAAVSHYSKAVDGAFSSVRKYDTRVTNDALTYAHAPIAHAAYAAPVAHAAYAAPVAHAAYAAPVHHHYAAPVAHAAYAAPVAHAAYAAPVAHAGYAAPVVAKAAIAYSPASVVSHATFDGLGVHYGW